MSYKQIKAITSYTGLSRYMAGLADTDQEIPRFAEIPSPYMFSPTHLLYERGDTKIFIVETAHRHFAVFELLDGGVR